MTARDDDPVGRDATFRRLVRFRPRRARSGADRNARRRFDRVVRLALKLDQTPQAYEDFLRAHAEEGLSAALTARSAQRWQNVRAGIPFAGALVFPRLWRLPPIDACLARHGLSYRAEPSLATSPSIPGVDWPAQLRWGIDSIAGAARFALLCQSVGAAAILRQQLERWTSNRATALGMDLVASPTSERIDAVWQGYPRRLALGKVYAAMSELLHGRGTMLGVVRWEAAGLAASPPPADAADLAVFAELGVALQFQVIGAILGSLGLPHDEQSRLVESRPVGDPPPLAMYEPVAATLTPLVPSFLASGAINALAGDASVYEDWLADRGAPSELPADALAVLAYLHRRHRAAQSAIGALEEEAARIPEDFNLGRLEARAAHLSLVAEAAGLAGKWVNGPRSDALVTASSALRSALHLWLEDDTRAMIPVRTIFESVARLRSWRLKPRKASLVESRGSQTTTRDWVAVAGWRRLAVLNEALGELSHLDYGSRWGGALDALSALQPGAAEDPHAIHTARGSTLGRAAELLAIETTEAMRPVSDALATGTAAVLGLSGGGEEAFERWLRHAHDQRGFDFGQPTFVRADASGAPADA